MAKVLIVEDSVSQAAIMAELVKAAGHEVLIAKDFAKGVVQSVLPHNPDIVLLDLILLDSTGKQVADGFQLCREIKRSSQGKIKVVIVSSKEDEESSEWALLQGADAFLHKPFAVPDLINVMNSLI